MRVSRTCKAAVTELLPGTPVGSLSFPRTHHAGASRLAQAGNGYSTQLRLSHSKNFKPTLSFEALEHVVIEMERVIHEVFH
jgi:hypothetical protein